MLQTSGTSITFNISIDICVLYIDIYMYIYKISKVILFILIYHTSEIAIKLHLVYLKIWYIFASETAMLTYLIQHWYDSWCHTDIWLDNANERATTKMLDWVVMTTGNDTVNNNTHKPQTQYGSTNTWLLISNIDAKMVFNIYFVFSYKKTFFWLNHNKYTWIHFHFVSTQVSKTLKHNIYQVNTVILSKTTITTVRKNTLLQNYWCWFHTANFENTFLQLSKYFSFKWLQHDTCEAN